MSLIQCPKCGKQISDKAVECPKCGHRMRQVNSGESDSLLSDAQESNAAKPIKRKIATSILMGISILVVAAIAFATGAIFFGGGEAKSTSDAVSGGSSDAQKNVEGDGRDMGFKSGHAAPARNSYVTAFELLGRKHLTLKEDESGLLVMRSGAEIGKVVFGGSEDDFEMLLTVNKEGDGAKEDIIALTAAALISYNDDLTDINEALEDARDIYKYGTSSGYLYGMQTYEVGNTDGGKNLAVKIKPMNQ